MCTPRSAAVVFGALVGVALGLVVPVASAQATPSAEALIDPGAGWTLVDEQPGAHESLIRTYQSDAAFLILNAIPVTTPPGVRSTFEFFTSMEGFEAVPEESLDLAAWAVEPGTQLDNGVSAELTFAARDFIFIFAAQTNGSVDPVALLRDLAQRQVAAAGGPAAAEIATPERSADESQLVAILPAAPPDGYDLSMGSTATGSDELTAEDDVNIKAAEFLNDNSVTATRVWASTELAGAVSITRFPYDIFAAAAVHEATHGEGDVVISDDALPDAPDVVTFRDGSEGEGQIGTAFRRGDLFVLVLTQRTTDVPEETALALATDLSRLTVDALPVGGTTPYEFPSAPSKVLGLALTAAIVTAAACGAAVMARLRARRLRRQWESGELPPPEVGDPVRRGTAIALDDEARRLRRQGGIIAVVQILAVNIAIVALAGDFRWPGVIVAAAALVAGLLLTHWWHRRELGLLGAPAPGRKLVVPSPTGAVMLAFSLAVLVFGVAFLLKGLRYLFLKPTLVQLKWSNWLGVAPRTVGVIFVIGGFVAAIVGGWLFRLGRAFSRAGTKRTLQLDPRPAALYLRSFEDDKLPLPTIASARRPLFELFSPRGADPFEESIAWELNSYGPVVAVGRPGGRLASLGAAREHLPDETWREQVAARMDQAGIIAVATGETDGLAWELGQVVSGGHMDKTFFVFPPVAPGELGRRWEHTAASLEHAGQAVGPLPMPHSRIHTVRLDPDGTPTVTYASRRDEATYRTAVDHAVTPLSGP